MEILTDFFSNLISTLSGQNRNWNKGGLRNSQETHELDKAKGYWEKKLIVHDILSVYLFILGGQIMP